MFKRKYPFYLTLCAIAKNEGRYLQEWIEYHKMLGVEKFFIYDNESAWGDVLGQSPGFLSMFPLKYMAFTKTSKVYSKLEKTHV